MHLKSRDTGIALLLVAIAVAVRAYGVGWGLPQVFEEGVPLKKAWEMWGWGAERSADFNPHFFKYPSLMIYLQLLGQAILLGGMKLSGAVASTLDFEVLYFVNKTPFYITGRMITVLLGSASVLVTFLAGRRVAGLAVAVPASFLLAINTLHVSKSQTVEVDVPLTFFAILALYFFLRIAEEGSLKNYILAGVATGLAVSTKYTAALLVVPMITSHFLSSPAGADGGAEMRARKMSFFPLGIALGSAALGFILTSPYVLLDFLSFMRDLSAESQHMSLGHFGLGESSSTVAFYSRTLVGPFLGWPLALLASGGIVFLAGWQRNRWAIVLAAFVVPYLIAVGSWAMMADRYLLPILPAALLLACGFVAAAMKSQRMARHSPTLRWIALSLATLICAIPAFAAYPAHFARLQPDTRSLAKEWIEANVPPGSCVAMEMSALELLDASTLRQARTDVRRIVRQKLLITPFYAVQPLLMFQVEPQRSSVYYDLTLLREADIIVTTSSVRSRYANNPTRFPVQIAFYDSLDASYPVLRVFEPGSGSGPTLTVYRNPKHNLPFGARKDIQPPVRIAPAKDGSYRSEDVFYGIMALNNETFRHYVTALACYQLALRYPVSSGDMYLKLTVGAVRCFIALGQPDQAAEFLQSAADRAPSDKESRELLRIREKLIQQTVG